jgi:hypothetical protein
VSGLRENLDRGRRACGPGGRLVEEDDPRRPHQGHRQVKAALHAAREVEHRLLARVGQVEQPEQFCAPLAALLLGQV